MKTVVPYLSDEAARTGDDYEDDRRGGKQIFHIPAPKIGTVLDKDWLDDREKRIRELTAKVAKNLGTVRECPTHDAVLQRMVHFVDGQHPDMTLGEACEKLGVCSLAMRKSIYRGSRVKRHAIVYVGDEWGGLPKEWGGWRRKVVSDQGESWACVQDCAKSIGVSASAVRQTLAGYARCKGRRFRYDGEEFPKMESEQQARPIVRVRDGARFDSIAKAARSLSQQESGPEFRRMQQRLWNAIRWKRFCEGSFWDYASSRQYAA
jgi:hypothetical protein